MLNEIETDGAFLGKRRCYVW